MIGSASNIDRETTDDPVATVYFDTPGGRIVVMADIGEQYGTRLELYGLHMHHESPGSTNAVGAENLMQMAQRFMKELGYDELLITGARRTTGARPGTSPRTHRIPRRP